MFSLEGSTVMVWLAVNLDPAGLELEQHFEFLLERGYDEDIDVFGPGHGVILTDDSVRCRQVVVVSSEIIKLSAAGLLEGDPAALPEFADIKAVIATDHGDDDTLATKPSSIEDWAGDIAALLKAGAGPTAIYDRLRLDERFEGSLGGVKRLCLRLRKAQGISADDVAIPVETVAGEVAQVDFGYVGQLYDPDEGRMRKAWIFVMVLGFSRLMGHWHRGSRIHEITAHFVFCIFIRYRPCTVRCVPKFRFTPLAQSPYYTMISYSYSAQPDTHRTVCVRSERQPNPSQP